MYELEIHKIYCPNCSSIMYGYNNDDGKTKFSCTRCGYSRLSKKAGRHKLKTDEFFPNGGVFYGEEKDFVPDEEEVTI